MFSTTITSFIYHSINLQISLKSLVSLESFNLKRDCKLPDGRSICCEAVVVQSKTNSTGTK